MCWCVDMLMCWCVDVLMCWSGCVDVLICWCVTGCVEVSRFDGLCYNYADVLMCWCVDDYVVVLMYGDVFLFFFPSPKISMFFLFNSKHLFFFNTSQFQHAHRFFQSASTKILPFHTCVILLRYKRMLVCGVKMSFVRYA